MRKLYNIVLVVAIMVVVALLVLYLVFGTVELGRIDGKPKLIIDHDGGADDAMAIFMALLYEKYYNGPEVLALTTTHGNVGEEQTYNNSQRILSVANRRDVPIFRGSAEALISGVPMDYYFGVDGLGDNNFTKTFMAIAAKKEHAVFSLINLSKKYKDKLVVIALGSLTNIALAIRIDPDFVSRLSQLYVAAGHIYGENFTEPEFNAAMDVEAYHIVVNSGDPDKLTIIPYSQILTYQIISKDWRENVLGSIKTKIMQAQNSFERISFASDSFWSLLDPSAMAVALKETAVVEETVYTHNSIILCGDQRGINTNNFTSKEEANARLIFRVNKEPYKQFLYKLFSSDLEKL
ncbi:probable uridine nucleosidase 2 [Maniola jurtina]|uniref:probable uridine nucleosidase 2 n=1 Tax=Maniola jurtina TaxID=191418 RepID=UPI001E68EDBC|nr:probable uridine nucleosidase 2 [Maniola jurtina]